MHCPKCRTADLKPTKLEDGLPAMGCNDCGGSLLSLLYYRDWAERHHPTASEDEVKGDVSQDADAKTALACPKCSKLMTKFLVSGEYTNRIDLCSSCDEAWLDGGEWQMLKSLELADKLPKVFTDQWQRNIRNQKMEAMKLERLKKVVGEEDADKAEAIRSWLLSHPHKGVLVHYMGSE